RSDPRFAPRPRSPSAPPQQPTYSEPVSSLSSSGVAAMAARKYGLDPRTIYNYFKGLSGEASLRPTGVQYPEMDRSRARRLGTRDLSRFGPDYSATLGQISEWLRRARGGIALEGPAMRTVHHTVPRALLCWHRRVGYAQLAPRRRCGSPLMASAHATAIHRPLRCGGRAGGPAPPRSGTRTAVEAAMAAFEQRRRRWMRLAHHAVRRGCQRHSRREICPHFSRHERPRQFGDVSPWL